MSPLTASQLAFNPIQPGDGIAGVTLGAVTVDVADQYGNIVPGNSSVVALSLSSNSFLSGSVTTVAAKNGVAIFNKLTVGTAGTYAFTAKAMSLTSAASNSFTVVPADFLTLTPAALPGGVSGNGYGAALGAFGGSGLYTFALQSDTLPPGLTLSSAGLISGKPTQAGVYTFTVIVTDSNDGSLTGSFTYSLTVGATVGRQRG